MHDYKFDISIIIPCYNCEKYVGKTINSILNQDYLLDKIEIILINDGSKDNTLDIINKYKSDNVVIIDKENSGVSSTRNKGIELAQGKYILFLDSDDYLSSNAIRDITSFFDIHYDEVDIVTYPIVFFYPNGKKVMQERYRNSYIKGTAVYDLNDYYHLVQTTVNVVIKNDKKHFFDVNRSYAEDEKFNIEIIMEKKKIGVVMEAIYYYRRHQESVTANRFNMNLEDAYSHYKILQDKYNNDPFIQSVIINNLNWRLNESCIFPQNIKDNEREIYLKTIRERLKYIDFSLFKDRIIQKKDNFLELLGISNKNFTVRKVDKIFKLYDGEKILIDEIDFVNYIECINIEVDKFIFVGKIISPIFFEENTILYAHVTNNKGKEEKIKVKTYNEYQYQSNYIKNYELRLNKNEIREISFYIVFNDEKIFLKTKYSEWCSKYKLYDNKQLKIDNTIMVKRKKVIDTIFNKFYKNRKIKFLMINLLSILYKVKRCDNLYFGDKDSLIYKMYLKDENKYKKFYSNSKGIKYKMRLLNCKYLFTDKKIKEVIPFGTMQKLYIQSSRFQIVNIESKKN